MLAMIIIIVVMVTSLVDQEEKAGCEATERRSSRVGPKVVGEPGIIVTELLSLHEGLSDGDRGVKARASPRIKCD